MGNVPDELKNVVRGVPPQHQPHQQPMRLNSFGEESLDSLLGDSLGMYALCAVFRFTVFTSTQNQNAASLEQRTDNAKGRGVASFYHLDSQ